jgi:plastocyanin
MKKLAAFLALALASLALVACGNRIDNATTASTTGTATNSGAAGATTAGGNSAAAAETIDLEADPDGQLAFTSDSLTAKAGNVTIAFDNPAPISHDVAVEDSAGNEVGQSDLIAQSSTSLVLKNLKPGTYTYFCTVPGHREAGMEGTLTVK